MRKTQGTQSAVNIITPSILPSQKQLKKIETGQSSGQVLVTTPKNFKVILDNRLNSKSLIVDAKL